MPRDLSSHTPPRLTISTSYMFTPLTGKTISNANNDRTNPIQPPSRPIITFLRPPSNAQGCWTLILQHYYTTVSWKQTGLVQSQPTPFISVFEDQARAENWALSLRNRDVTVAEIDTSLLRNAVAFPLKQSTTSTECWYLEEPPNQ